MTDAAAQFSFTIALPSGSIFTLLLGVRQPLVGPRPPGSRPRPLGARRPDSRDLLVIDVGDTRFALKNTSDQTAGYRYGKLPRAPIQPDERDDKILQPPADGEVVELFLFTNESADPIPFVTLKLTKKTG